MRLCVLALLLVTACQKPPPPPPAIVDAGARAVVPPPETPSFVFAPATIPPFDAAAFPAPPVAKKQPVTADFHGKKLTDAYAWMKKKGAKELVAYLRDENAYTDAVMAKTKALQDTLYAEMHGRVQETDTSAPYLMRGYWYYSREEAGKPYSVSCRKKGEAGAEEVLLDLNELGKKEKFIDLGTEDVSDDNRLLAYTIDVSGFREYTLFVKDLTTGTPSSERIPHVTSATWAADNTTIFYTTENSAKRSYRLYRHTLGAPIAKDALVYEEKDEHFDIDVSRTRSMDFLVLHIQSLSTTEDRVLEATKPAGVFRVVLPRKQNREYELDHHGPSFFIRINDTGRNFRLVEVPADAPDVEARWKELVPTRNDVMLEGISVFRDFYVLHERAEGLPRLRSVQFASGEEATFEVPEADCDLSSFANAEYDTGSYRFVFTSLVTPPTVLERDIKSGRTSVIKVHPVPTYDHEKYETLRVTASAGKARIPVSLAFKKGTRRDGTHPMLLRGYGAYGIPYDPAFSATDVSFLDRGVILAIAHIRGGGDLGKPWHDAGRLMMKKNTFNDFIGCAESLIADKWTSKDRLAINGASAGGLLMGAVLNQRPELFKTALVEVPFVDVVNTMLDESLPLTVPEFEEWGNPKEPVAGEYMLSYSPYDNVEAKAYPAMMVRSSYNDSQVLFHEPTKYVAKLRALKTDSNPLLLRMEMDPAGHSGRSGRYNWLHDEAYYDAFLLWQLGITQ